MIFSSGMEHELQIWPRLLSQLLKLVVNGVLKLVVNGGLLYYC